MAANPQKLKRSAVTRILDELFPGQRCTVTGYELRFLNEAAFLGFPERREKLTFTFRSGDGGEAERSFLAKTPSERSPDGKDRATLERGFRREMEVYENVFSKLEKESGALVEWHPKFHLSQGGDVIVLEDLTSEGYYSHRERSLMDEEHLLRSLEAVAAMHSSSVAYEESGPGEVDRLESVLSDPASSSEGWLRDATELSISAQLSILDVLPGYTPTQMETIRRQLPLQMRRLPYLRKPSEKFRNVIIHGSLCSHSLLFLGGCDGSPKTARITDFRLAGYGPPAQDVVTFLHLAQSKEFREVNHKKLLKHYHTALANNLERHGLDADRLFPWYELLGTCDYYEELGVLTALVLLQFVLTEKETHARILSSPHLIVDRYKNDPVFSSRFTEAMNQLIQDYIL